MPTDSKPKTKNSLPSSWKEFLLELDSMLTEPLDLHCIGGFVICYFYGLPRTRGDIDYYTAVPANINLIEMAGEGSEMAKKHKVCSHHVGVTNLPENYETRLTEMVPGMFKQLRLYVPDPYDLILSKLGTQQPERSRRWRLHLYTGTKPQSDNTLALVSRFVPTMPK
jgi:hypothetical protein